MKIRSGFVSNSSSSSFLVCGISDIDSINSVLMKNDIMNSEITDTDSILYSYYIRHGIEHILGLEVHRNEHGRICLGKSISLDYDEVDVNQVKELINDVENILSDVDPGKIVVDYVTEEY